MMKIITLKAPYFIRAIAAPVSSSAWQPKPTPNAVVGLFPVPSRHPFRGSGKPPDATSRGRGFPGESPDRGSPGIPREIDQN
eukprot:scaffold5511_cov94-Skeletonema_dohrnii-CCMP3373.AAC.1